MSIKNLCSISLILIALILCACKKEVATLNIPNPSRPSYGNTSIGLNKENYHDKVLGALVGSAIGDAMGLSTEMWNREDIQRRYGYITTITPALMEESAEGPWGHNLPAGATTDDTRWKAALTNYITSYKPDLSAPNFAQFVIDYYQDNAKTLSDDSILTQPDGLDAKIEKINWIKEWARVAFAFKEDSGSYRKLRDRFYGGEMSCAGLLYTPMFGLIAPNAETAYELAYEHTIFDIGYARDISSSAAAMTNIALQTRDMDSILRSYAFVDPYKYGDSRLIGRISQAIANEVEDYVLASFEIDEIAMQETLSMAMKNMNVNSHQISNENSIHFKIPKNYPGTSLEWHQQETIYQALEENQRMIAFHAGEIWEILYASLKFGDGDFRKTMEFIVNYGRDNDTVAAIAGMILGAKDGFNALPEELRETVLKTNKEVLGIDLEQLALKITNQTYPK